VNLFEEKWLPMPILGFFLKTRQLEV